MVVSRRRILGCAAAALSPTIARAASGPPIRIGVLTDMNGPFADNTGLGSVIAARLAAEDFGNRVVDRPVEILSADHQNKADIAVSIARAWIDTEGVTAIADGASSSAGLAIQQVAREKRCVFLISGSTSSDLTNRACSPFGFHFVADTYAFGHSTGRALTRLGGDSWFFVTADYAFGHALERDTAQAVTEVGGKVLGAVRHPLGTTDFGSYLTQARSSGAKVIGFANAGADVQNALKQAAEFHTAGSGQRLAALLLLITNVRALGLPVVQGLTLSTSFYWDLNDATRAWTKRFKVHKDYPPTMMQAGTYSGVRHYLRAVQAAGTTGGDEVAAAMHAMPVDDMFNAGVPIRQDGRVLERLYLMQVKSPSESAYTDDFYTQLSVIPGEEAFRPLSQSECDLVQR